MEKSDSNIGLFFCSHSRPNSSEGSAKESRRAGTAEYVTKDQRRIKSPCGSHRRKAPSPLQNKVKSVKVFGSSENSFIFARKIVLNTKGK